jgi:hypothetical protein
MSCTRLAECLAATCADRRAAVYSELTALAHGDASDATTGLATATLRLALAGEALEDEAKLTERLERFGTVLAVTVRRDAEGTWALVTFDSASESERALEGAAAELGAESVVVRMDTQQALGSTGSVGEAMNNQRRLVEARVAASCVAPLMETVLCADAAEVGVQEYQRAAIVLASLCLMDREVTTESMRNDRFAASWRATGNAVNLAIAKDQAQLTRDDAMTIACSTAHMAVCHAQGLSGVIARADGDQRVALVSLSTHYPLLTGRLPIEEVELPQRLTLLLLDICRDPQGASAEAVAGAWLAVAWALVGRPAVAAVLLDAGLLEAAVARFHTSSAVEWANWRSPGMKDGLAFCPIAILCTLELPGLSLTQRLVDSGTADAMTSLLKVR